MTRSRPLCEDGEEEQARQEALACAKALRPMGFACSRKRGTSSVAGTPGGVRRLTKGTANTQPSRPFLASFFVYFTGVSPCPQVPHLLLLKSDPHTSELCLPPPSLLRGV